MLLGVTVGCTSDSEPGAGPSPLPSRSVGSAPTLDAKPVPTEVTVAKVVGGRLDAEQRRHLVKQVSDVLSTYYDEAFLAGEYPRRDFSSALRTFSSGAEDRARADRALLTNAEIGADTEGVQAVSKRASLDVLVPNRHVLALTARIRLVFVQERTEGADQRVTVKGRLLMDRRKSGPWRIFGYDVQRWSESVSRGAGR